MANPDLQKSIRLFSHGKSFRGTVDLPASKSISNRLLMLRALSRGLVEAGNLSESEDTRLMLQALDFKSGTINIGHAGTAMRFLTAYLAVTPGDYVLTGSERMKNRPLGKLVDALRSLGADIQYLEKEGYPPLQVHGKELTGHEVSIDGSTSSQYISALLMIAPVLPEGLTLHLTGTVISASYIRMTLGLLEKAGIKHTRAKKSIHIPRQEFHPMHYNAEPDWSAASYWYELAAFSDSSEILIKGLERESLQGDARIATIFEKLGVSTTFNKEGALLKKIPVQATQFSDHFIEIPDMVQTVVVSCALLGIPFIIHGAQSLRIKETDRITALQNEINRFGIKLEYSADGTLAWNGKKSLTSASVPSIRTYQDHRMALSFAPVVALTGELIIEDPDVVIKSYPSFWGEMRKLGIGMQLSES